ncbi:MAG: hypothetical protein MUP11_00485 [Anaerolineales bacterium]|nr:hypothetical protein [Anaerolineales bacterium]
MSKPKLSSLLKPTVATPFQIDFDWWKEQDRSWRVNLRSSLCAEHQEMYADLSGDEKVDWIDPETAEVQIVDGLQHTLISHCAKQEDFITEHTTLTEALFRTFLSNGNQPLSPDELAEVLDTQPQKILQTISGPRVYKGIRPAPRK